LIAQGIDQPIENRRRVAPLHGADHAVPRPGRPGRRRLGSADRQLGRLAEPAEPPDRDSVPSSLVDFGSFAAQAAIAALTVLDR
jgi:hypothetical protein